MNEMVSLHIDGRQAIVPKGTLLVEAAKTVGIEIPIFCYHPKLISVGACRMCIVEIEGFPKPQPACTTEVSEGMVVRTRTPEVRKMWEGVLEFLLINHPLDCPVCDRGGECPLQDNTFKFGPQDSRFTHEKRHFPKPVPLSPLVVLDRERCIMCFRCVRFCEEISHHPEIKAFSRGGSEYIDIFPGRPFQSRFSGNTIELCPVGALLSSVFRFRARPWEIQPTESICPACGAGCNIRIDARNNREVVRFLARENDEVNEVWLCDRGRFSSDFINSPERLTSPLRRINGELQEVTWNEALDFAASELRRFSDNPRQIGGIGSVERSNEQNYLFQKLMRMVLKTNNIDYKVAPRGRTTAVGAANAEGMFSGSIKDITAADVVLVLGADVSEELPILDLWLKKAWRQGIRIILAHPLEIEISKFSSPFVAYRHDRPRELAAALARAAESGDAGEEAALAGIGAQTARELGPVLQQASRLLVLVHLSLLEDEYGMDVLGSLRRILSREIKRDGDWVKAMLLTEGANEQGAMDLGLLPGYLPGYIPLEQAASLDYETPAVPDWPGMQGMEMMRAATRGEMKALYVMGSDPAADPIYGDEVRDALSRLDFLLVQDCFLTSTAQMADVVLPTVTLAETTGTFTSTERRVQRFLPAIRPRNGAWEDTTIITHLAHRLGAQFKYASIEEIFEEITRVVRQYRGLDYRALGSRGKQWGLESSSYDR